MKFIRVLVVLALMLSLGVLATGCNSKKDVAAEVNGTEISLADLNQQVDALKKQYPTMFTGSDGEGRLLDFKQRLLDNMISQVLVEQAAEDKGVKVTDADVDAQIKQLKSGFEDQAKFDEALKSAGMTEETLRKQVREQLITQALIEKLADSGYKPTQSEIQAYFDTNKSQFQEQAATRASHILFAAKDKATAQKVLAEVKAGGDFAALAKKYSTDTATKAKGGDLGWPTTALRDRVRGRTRQAQGGSGVSALVKTQYGWHIIKATDIRKATTKKLADVQDQIEQILVQQKKSQAYQDYIETLRKDAKIEVLVERLEGDEEPAPRRAASSRPLLRADIAWSQAQTAPRRSVSSFV